MVHDFQAFALCSLGQKSTQKTRTVSEAAGPLSTRLLRVSELTGKIWEERRLQAPPNLKAARGQSPKHANILGQALCHSCPS